MFLGTNPLIPQEPQIHPAALVPFATPTDDTARQIRAAQSGAAHIWRQGFRYKMAGVMLLELATADQHQGLLFDDRGEEQAPRRARLMGVMDGLNARMGGAGTVCGVFCVGGAGAALAHATGAIDPGLHHVLGGAAEG